MISAQEAKEKINQLAIAGEEFFFISDFLGENFEVFNYQDILQKKILFSFPNSEQVISQDSYHSPMIKILQSPNYSEYLSAFNQIREEQQIGNSYLTNLTFPIEITCDSSFDDIFATCSAQYKILLPDHFICFSPETFIKIQDSSISTYPMKGTFTAKELDDPQALLKDPKEAAEHATVVDLLRNDLSQVANHVRVTNYRYLDKIIAADHREHYQVSSEISGELPSNYLSNLGEIIVSLLPAGSISGAPKIKTVQIINNTETYQRGFYTGIAGYFNGESLYSSVMIRFIEQIQNRLFFKTGGGITTDSDPQKEYQEMLDKVYIPIANYNNIHEQSRILGKY